MGSTKGKSTAAARPQKNTTTSDSKVSKSSAKGKMKPTAAAKKAAVAASKKHPKVSSPELDPAIRCPCGNQEAEPDDPLRTNFVCCMTCEKWQHNICMGLWDNDRDIPQEYYCDECREADHPSLKKAKDESEGGGKKWAESRLDTFALDAEDEQAAKVKRNRAVEEVLEFVRSNDALYDYWAIPLEGIDAEWSPVAQQGAADVERSKLIRASEIVLRQSLFAQVEKVRKMLVLSVHDGPVTKTEKTFEAVRRLVDEDEEMVQAIELNCTVPEHADVRAFFGLPME